MKHRLLTILFAALLTGTLLTGCSGDTNETPEVSGTQTEEASNADTENTEPIVVSFEATDIDGNAVTSDIFKDSKLTMINVWATYCNPCLKEMPDLGALAAEYDSADFQILGVVSDVMENAEADAVQEAKDLIEQTQANYPHLLLNDSLYYAFAGSATAVPTTFFFNENCEYIYGVVGSADKATWKELIDELLAEM